MQHKDYPVYLQVHEEPAHTVHEQPHFYEAMEFSDPDHSDHTDDEDDHHDEEAQVILHEEQTPVLHQILPITSHRREEWLDEDPELHVQKFDELEHEFDDDHYHGLD